MRQQFSLASQIKKLGKQLGCINIFDDASIVCHVCHVSHRKPKNRCALVDHYIPIMALLLCAEVYENTIYLHFVAYDIMLCSFDAFMQMLLTVNNNLD